MISNLDFGDMKFREIGLKKSFLLLAICLIIAMTIFMIFFARMFKTTQQAAAESSPPPISKPTATITYQKLSVSLPVVCTAEFSNVQKLKPVVQGDPLSQYTRIAVVEDEVIQSGSLLAEINGKPIFAGLGDFSFYRDLHIDDKGPDARMFNKMFIEMGYLPAKKTDSIDIYDQESHKALVRLYEAYSYEGPSIEEGFSLNSMIILKNSSRVISKPRDTGTQGEEPIAEVADSHRALQCTGVSGQISPEVQDGQKLILPDYPNSVFTVSLSTVIADSSNQANDSSQDNTKTNQSSSTTIITSEPSEELDLVTGTLKGEVVLKESVSDDPVVPESALWTKDGVSVITLENSGKEEIVPVEIIFSANGYHKVRSLNGKNLQSGDTIRIYTGVE